MRHHHSAGRSIGVFLLVLIFGPYLAALAAVLAVIWLVIMLIALPFSTPRR
jgi:hypothetical protein